MKIGNREFDLMNHTYVMGILNVTPDSFSDGGKYNDIEKACIRVGEMIKEGVHIIDLGGESTRPNHIQITEMEEIERVIPFIEAIKREYDIPISLDTYKGNVAKAGIAAGVDLINDIWGLQYDQIMPEVVSKSGLPCVLMHNRDNLTYTNFIEDVTSDFTQIIGTAHHAGISEERIILDVGVGFGKTYEQNIQVMQEMEKFHVFGYPLLLGTSRKSVIQKTLNLPSNDCVEGTIATTILAVMKYCGFVRVHDIKENARAIQMAEALRGDRSHGLY